MARTPDPGATAAAGSNRKKAKKEKEMATIGETFGFVFGSGPKVTLLWIIGFVAGIMNGLVYPALAYFFSRSFSDLSGASSNGISAINNIAFTFMGIGGYALATGLAQNWAFEIVAYHSSQNFRLKVRVSIFGIDWLVGWQSSAKVFSDRIIVPTSSRPLVLPVAPSPRPSLLRRVRRGRHRQPSGSKCQPLPTGRRPQVRGRHRIRHHGHWRLGVRTGTCGLGLTHCSLIAAVLLG